MTRILTFGETLGVAVVGPGMPLRLAPTARLHIAGAESTVAIGLSRLGVHACWVGVVGTDEFGERIRRELAAENVDIASVRTTSARPTGFMLRELRTAELTRVTYFRDRSAGSMLAIADVERALVRFAPDLVHITGITTAISPEAAQAVTAAVAIARERRIEISLDINYRASLPGSGHAVELLRTIVRDVDLLFVSADETHVLLGDAPRPDLLGALAELGPHEVVLKCGMLGSSARCGDTTASVDAPQVLVADVVGAGDSFAAGYLAARAEDRSLEERLRWGSVCAAYTVGTQGDWEGLPDRAELASFDGASRTQR